MDQRFLNFWFIQLIRTPTFSFFLLLQSFLQTLPSACYTCHKWQKCHKLLEWLCTGMHGCTWVWVGACGYARVYVWDKLPNVICCIQCLLLCSLLLYFNVVTYVKTLDSLPLTKPYLSSFTYTNPIWTSINPLPVALN